ncbi:hypothetical protein M0805_008846 [Coniferiporia weirii]|nr:hypothetical protein M0805_008846 [Coniferiporia weirii]
MLLDLDIDVIIQVLALLGVEDILTLRLTSKHFASLSHLRTVWHTALVRHVLSQNLPVIPGKGSGGPGDFTQRGFTTFSAAVLERITRATLSADKNWRSGMPARTRTVRIRTKIGRSHVLRFLGIRAGSGETMLASEGNEEGRYLLSFGLLASPGASMCLCIQVWDVEATGQDAENGTRLAGEWVERGRVIGLAVDEGDGMKESVPGADFRDAKGTLVAVSARCSQVPGEDLTFVLRVLRFISSHSPSDPRSGFCEAKSFVPRGPVNVRALHGKLVVLQVHVEGVGHGHGILKVVDWVRSTMIFTGNARDGLVTEDNGSAKETEVAVELVPSALGVNRSVLRVHFAHDWVLVFRESVLEMYFLLPSALRPSSTTESRDAHTLRPAATHKWMWQINSLAVTERVSWVHERAAARCATCNGQGYISAEDKANNGEQLERIVCACRYRPLSLAVRFDSYFPWPVNLLHHYVLQVPLLDGTVPVPAPEPMLTQAPYALPPVLTDTIPSTVRLFGHSVLALGRFGTLLWTDSEMGYGGTDANAGGDANANGGTYYYAEGTGERAAGRRLPLPLPPPAHPRSWLQSWSTALPSYRSAPDVDPDADPNANANGGTTQPDPPQPTGSTDAGSGAGATTLYATRAREGWHALALCERAGRVVIGDAEGVLELWDHF